MNAPENIPCAHSEPRDIEDAVVSTLLRLAGNLAQWQESHQAPSPVPSLVEQLLEVVEQDAELVRLQAELPQALGSGALLQSVFLGLFPHAARPLAVSRSETIDPRLTGREREVLLEMAKGRSRQEITEHLSIASDTVKRHIRNIYVKLEVNNPSEAVAKAAALGLLTFDLAELVLPMVDGKNLDMTHFADMFLQPRVYAPGVAKIQQPDIYADPARPVAMLGLLLLLTAPLMRHDPRGSEEATRFANYAGVLSEYTPGGQFLRSFEGGGCLRVPYALAFAPPAAARQGFAPGHLFILNGHTFPDALNQHSILECAPDGQLLRTFTGGTHLSTRLNGMDMTFTSDGRLLACAGSRTDALLEFSQGGVCAALCRHHSLRWSGSGCAWAYLSSGRAVVPKSRACIRSAWQPAANSGAGRVEIGGGSGLRRCRGRPGWASLCCQYS